jgi:hypothetical protein
MVSILIARLYLGFDEVFPASWHAWTVIACTLILSGVITVVVAMAPQSWLSLIFGKIERHWLQLPFRTLAIFFAISYSIVAVLSILSPRAEVSPIVAYIVCPSCISTATVDPNLTTSLFFLAPTSAAAYGSIGALIGLAICAFRR